MVASTTIARHRRTKSHQTKGPPCSQIRVGATIEPAVVVTVTVTVSGFVPLNATGVGTAQVAELGTPLQPKETVPVNPPMGVSVTV